jgi:drug/metabolite transporter (DMT)-like permease
VCFFWGTTYLGIRIGVQDISPATLMSARYLASGLILVIGARITGAVFPTAREAGFTALFGIITIGGGTGSLAFSEQWISSGLAALFVTTQPFWLVGMERLFSMTATGGGREPLHARSIIGMIVGLAGVAYLVVPGTSPDASQVSFGQHGVRDAFIVLQIGALMWSAGSIAQRRLPTRAHPFVNGGIQQLATGIVFLFIAAFDGQKSHWTPSAIAAVTYLAIFGGAIGYSAYIFAMDRLPVAIVSIYTYINPVVAVVLGWLFYREQLGAREIVAMLVIFAGVALVKGFGKKKSGARRKESQPRA